MKVAFPKFQLQRGEPSGIVPNGDGRINLVVHERTLCRAQPKTRLGVHGEAQGQDVFLNLRDMDPFGRRLDVSLVTDAAGRARLEVTNPDVEVTTLSDPQSGLDVGEAKVSLEMGRLADSAWAGRSADLNPPDATITELQYLAAGDSRGVEFRGKQGVLYTLWNEDGYLTADSNRLNLHKARVNPADLLG